MFSVCANTIRLIRRNLPKLTRRNLRAVSSVSSSARSLAPLSADTTSGTYSYSSRSSLSSYSSSSSSSKCYVFAAIGALSLGILPAYYSSCSSMEAQQWAQAVPLTTIETETKPSATQPSVVYVHGLDSAKDTWSSVLKQMDDDKIGHGIAVDLRAHGESPVGEISEFSSDQVCADIRRLIVQRGDIPRPFVLCGHSMGGRVVMHYAAMYPNDIAALVVEDIDVKTRVDPDSEFSPEEIQRRLNFDRSFPSREACTKALLDYGYSQGRIDGWYQFGRILDNSDRTSQKIWTNVSPAAQYLARKHILATPEGVDDLKKVNIHESLRNNVHLLIAGQQKGSCCAISGIGGADQMKQILPPLKIHRFPNSGHSIHNIQRNEFMQIIKDILKQFE